MSYSNRKFCGLFSRGYEGINVQAIKTFCVKVKPGSHDACFVAGLVMLAHLRYLLHMKNVVRLGTV